MVRSKNSCFKILTCGSDSVDKDDLELVESKGSMDRRGWSFQKRSARHRVLSNTVISETLSTQTKESPESTRIDFHTQSNPTTPEKISISQSMDETPPLSMAINTKEPNSMISSEIGSKNDLLVSTDSGGKVDSLTTTVDASEINHHLDESVIILIQAAIRGYLARRALLKIKNAVKLQAVFRGHLVRRQAIGTLRCVQAIVKMQALVRARRYRMSLQCPISDVKVDRKPERSSQCMDPLRKENLGTKANRNYSTEKWLGNSFARKLLESAPKRKPIHIKCDPSRPDSAWKWLERWMAVSSSDTVQPQKQLNPEDQEQGQIDTTSELRTHIPAEILSDSADTMPVVSNVAIPLEVEENLITYDAGSFEFHACQPRSYESKDDMQQPPNDVAGFSISKEETSLTVGGSQIEIQSDATSSSFPCSIPSKPEADVEQSNHSLKRAASEQPETVVKKFAFGSRKACNPAFAAVQSKFEELSSPTTSIRSINSTGQVVGVEPKQENLSSPADSVARTKELSVAESLISPDARVHIGGSECGTELSISSTLDSPDRSEDGVGDSKHEVVMKKVGSVPIEATDNASNAVNIGIESKNGPSMSDLSLPYTTQVELEDIKGESIEAAVVSPLVEQQLGRNASEVQCQGESPLDGQICKSSPEGSPRSHITASESHGTPSSLVSTKAKRSKSDKSKHTQSRKSQSAGKQSPSNPNHDSGARSSTEQLPEDSKNRKRRNSFGSSRADNVEQEPRDSSSNSLPSYMQATESARAKAQANTSPRSSPDVQDKDFYIKKRHSLPGANGKQGSPRMQRSMSQAQPGVKGNGTFTRERKWQR